MDILQAWVEKPSPSLDLIVKNVLNIELNSLLSYIPESRWPSRSGYFALGKLIRVTTQSATRNAVLYTLLIVPINIFQEYPSSATANFPEHIT